ncbi:MAG: hypothetical protein ACHQX3_05155, partial [Nitrospirales bacterium]
VDAEGRDNGLRFIDVNGDGYDDVLFSNEKEFSLHLFVPKANPRLMWQVGWNDEVFAGLRLALNDVASTTLLAGVLASADDGKSRRVTARGTDAKGKKFKSTAVYDKQ